MGIISQKTKKKTPKSLLVSTNKKKFISQSVSSLLQRC
jgi:hypothetical protein